MTSEDVVNIIHEYEEVSSPEYGTLKEWKVCSCSSPLVLYIELYRATQNVQSTRITVKQVTCAGETWSKSSAH